MTEEPDLLQDAYSVCNFTMGAFSDYQEKLPKARLYGDNSAAAKEAEYAARQTGPAGPWSADLVSDLTQRAFTYLAINTQHVAAVRSLLSDGPHGLAFGPPVRGMMESSAKVAWLLDKELVLGEDVRRRVARFLLDVDDDATRVADIAKSFGHPDRTELKKRAINAHRRIKEPILFNPDELRKVDDVRLLCSEPLPGPVRYVKDAAAMFHPGRPSVDATYSYLSAMTHPSVFAFTDSIGAASSADDKGRVGIRNDAIFTAKLAHHGVQAFCDAWRLYSSWTGTTLDDVHSVIDEINRMQALMPE